MIYNAKFIKFKNTGEQDIRLYSNPIQTKDKDMERDEIEPKEKKPKEEKELTSAEQWANKERSIKTSQNRTINKIYEIARANDWEYFVTWTFSKEKVNRYDYNEVKSKLENWLRNIKKRKAKDMMYIIVPELHKDGAIHFHGLIKGIGAMKLINSGKRDKGRIIYNLGDYSWGWTTATEVTDTARASNYITKYITKELIVVTEGKKRYWASKNVDKPITEREFIDSDTMELLRTQYEIKNGQKKVIVDVNNYHQEIEYFTIL